jgi:hypothetical protein
LETNSYLPEGCPLWDEAMLLQDISSSDTSCLHLVRVGCNLAFFVQLFKRIFVTYILKTFFRDSTHTFILKLIKLWNKIWKVQ